MFNFEVKYIKGTKYTTVDILSRWPPVSDDNTENDLDINEIIIILNNEIKIYKLNIFRFNEIIYLFHIIEKSFSDQSLIIINFILNQIKIDIDINILNNNLDAISFIYRFFYSLMIMKSSFKLFKPCFNKIFILSIKFFRYRNIDFLFS